METRIVVWWIDIEALEAYTAALPADMVAFVLECGVQSPHFTEGQRLPRFGWTSLLLNSDSPP